MPGPEDEGPAFDRRVRELFDRALSLPPHEREAFLLREAPDEPAVRARAAALLAKAAEPTLELAPELREAPQPERPERIGPYRILDQLGTGGMGTVYLAEQQQPVKRRVALKLIKLGMDSKAVVARFEQERQALALMDHEGIAKVYDCGTSERGQPYFAMEHVKGVPLDEFCERQQLSLKDRIVLIQQVCAAVQHAHMKGVVHRDLKPGNVLVSDDGGKLQVKVIDFGLAKAMGQRLVEATLFTEVGTTVGTPEYMAPEQADPSNQDIDTRADVYSLGVMLYEVLCGQLPFSGAELREAGLLEMRRILREVDPPKPSTKITKLGDSGVVVAKARRVSLPALKKALSGDLDWVVLKALEKERNRRYDTANALSADLQRYLEHEPLVAGPPSAGYRLKKLVRRYRGQVVATGLLAGTIVMGAGATFLQWRRAEAEASANLRLAHENDDLAKKEASARRAAQNLASAEAAATANLSERVREFHLLAMLEVTRSIKQRADRLPELDHYDKEVDVWRRDCDDLLEHRDEVVRVIELLRRRSEQGRIDGTDLAGIDASFLAARRTSESLRRGLAIHASDEPATIPALGEDELRLDVAGLDEKAKELRDFRARTFRKGTESRALALFDRAWTRRLAGDLSGPSDAQLRRGLAYALIVNGRFEDAARLEPNVIPVSDDFAAAEGQGVQPGDRLRLALRRHLEWIESMEVHLVRQFLLARLEELRAEMADLEDNVRPRVRREHTWFLQLRLDHPNARVSWATARAAIAAADGVVASTEYAGKSIGLADAKVLGLVPIGMNPRTRLWEFYDLRSAWDGESDPLEIAIPTHEPDGSIVVNGDNGIVFVLLPGGTVTLGSQSDDENAPFYDPQCRNDETLHELTLSPFFLARHELTQGQWSRLWTWDAELRNPSQYKAGANVAGNTITLANPVEQVDWAMCERLLTRHGLVLPTEAQWEYGCRGGTDTPWNVDLSALKAVANLASQDAKPHGLSWQLEAWRDGQVVHAPVGSYGANRFGLYDVHGNVYEWCRDWHGDYGSERQGDGQRSVRSSPNRVNRGGSFNSAAVLARSANRSNVSPTFRDGSLGLRPSRLITL